VLVNAACESLVIEGEMRGSTATSNIQQNSMPNPDRLALLMAVLTGFIFAASICTGAAPILDAAEAIWPTKEWQTSTPEEQGVDSKARRCTPLPRQLSVL